MAIYRNKQVFIEAMRYGPHVGPSFSLMMFLSKSERPVTLTPDGILIETLEGQMRAEVGDWIIKGVKGEFYPCKNDVFEATYDFVSESVT